MQNVLQIVLLNEKLKKVINEWICNLNYKIYYYKHSPLIISDPVSYHLTQIHVLVVGLSQLIIEWSFNAKKKDFISIWCPTCQFLILHGYGIL